MDLHEKIQAIIDAGWERDLRKYEKRMTYQVMSVEYDDLYNVLVLHKPSKYNLTNRWELKVVEILGENTVSVREYLKNLKQK
jgi:hypothetical protein